MDPVRTVRSLFPVLALLAGGVFGVALQGCGSNSSVTAPAQAYISGTVRLSGVPVAGAVVASSTTNYVSTNASGVYTLTVTAGASVAVAASYSHSGVNYVATAVVATGAAGTTTTQDLALVVAQGGGGGNTRYTVTAYLARSASSDSGTALVVVQDDSLNAPVTNALVTLTPSGGQSVTLLQQSGTYMAVGSHTGYFPYLPMNFGGTFQLRVDVNGDGSRVATAMQKLPGLPTITAPAANGSVGSTFDMNWALQPATDSTGYYAVLSPSAPSPLQGVVYNTTTAHFTGVAAGTHVASLTCWRGPWFGNPAPGGGTVTANVVGPGVSGYFWAATTSDPVTFTVAAYAP